MLVHGCIPRVCSLVDRILVEGLAEEQFLKRVAVLDEMGAVAVSNVSRKQEMFHFRVDLFCCAIHVVWLA
jgi:hypothetical protein